MTMRVGIRPSQLQRPDKERLRKWQVEKAALDERIRKTMADLHASLRESFLSSIARKDMPAAGLIWGEILVRIEAQTYTGRKTGWFVYRFRDKKLERDLAGIARYPGWTERMGDAIWRRCNEAQEEERILVVDALKPPSPMLLQRMIEIEQLKTEKSAVEDAISIEREKAEKWEEHYREYPGWLRDLAETDKLGQQDIVEYLKWTLKLYRIPDETIGKLVADVMAYEGYTIKEKFKFLKDLLLEQKKEEPEEGEEEGTARYFSPSMDQKLRERGFEPWQVWTVLEPFVRRGVSGAKYLPADLTSRIARQRIGDQTGVLNNILKFLISVGVILEKKNGDVLTITAHANSVKPEWMGLCFWAIAEENTQADVK